MHLNFNPTYLWLYVYLYKYAFIDLGFEDLFCLNIHKEEK